MTTLAIALLALLDVTADSVTAARVNPVGVSTELTLHARHNEPNGDDVPSARFLGVLGGVLASPALLRPQLGLEVQPWPWLRAFVSYEPLLAWGTFGNLHTYPSPRSDVRMSAFDAAPPDGGERATVLHQPTGGFVLQWASHDVALRSSVRVHWLHAELGAAQGTSIYHPLADVVVGNDGWLFENDTDAAMTISGHVQIGIRHSLVRATYPAETYRANELHDGLTTARLGPTVRVRLGSDPDAPALSMVAQTYLLHPYRTGVSVPRAVPFLALSFTFKHDLGSAGGLTP